MGIPLDEVVTFDLITRGSSGVADADSAPTYDIFEDTTDTAILAAQTMTKRTSQTGDYRGTFTASAANGFEVGKWYNVIATGIVGGVTDKTVAMTFMLDAAQTAAGVPKVDVAYLLGTAWLTPGTAGTPDVNVKLWNGLTTVALPLVPTTAGRTLDVTATGAAGIDWGNVENPTTANNLSATTINLVNTVTTVTNQLTAAAIATGVWQDATAGDFTVASSIGKALYINNVAPGAAGGHFISGSNAGTTTVGAFTCTGNFTVSGNWLTSGTTTWTGAAAFSAGLTSNITGTITTVTNLTNLPSIPANWLTAAGINADAFTAAKFAADVGAEFADAVWDEAIAGHLTAGSTGAALNAAGSAGDPWSTTLPGAYTGSQAGALLAGIDAQLPGIAASATDAASFSGLLLNTLVPANGQVSDSTPTSSSFVTSRTEPDNFWNDARITFTSGDLTGQSRVITTYSADGRMTFDEPFTSAPVDTNQFAIASDHVHPVAQIAAAVRTNLTSELGKIVSLDTRVPLALGPNGNIAADVYDFNGAPGVFTDAGMPSVVLGNTANHGGASAGITLEGMTIVNSLSIDGDLFIGGELDVAINGLPWNAAWDAEVQSEAADALAAYPVPTAAQNAAAWGSSIIGNGRTRDYFLQGGCNKIDFAADGLSFTVLSTDDLTPLYTGIATRLATTIGPLRSVDPT